jgi:hypothetical protein
MKTNHYYSVTSAVQFEIRAPINITIDVADIELKINEKQFLSEVKITIPGNRIETDGLAHKIIKFITDTFFSEYAHCCEAAKYKVEEVKDDNDKNKISECIAFIHNKVAFRKSIKTMEELNHKLSTYRYLNSSTPLSSFADGLRATSPIERYGSFFKIIECIYTPRNRHMAEDLKASTQLLNLINKHKGLLEIISAEDIIDNLVLLRHNCGHLKPNANRPIGFTTSEQAQVKQIKDALPLLEKVSRELIQ